MDIFCPANEHQKWTWQARAKDCEDIDKNTQVSKLIIFHDYRVFAVYHLELTYAGWYEWYFTKVCLLSDLDDTGRDADVVIQGTWSNQDSWKISTPFTIITLNPDYWIRETYSDSLYFFWSLLSLILVQRWKQTVRKLDKNMFLQLQISIYFLIFTEILHMSFHILTCFRYKSGKVCFSYKPKQQMLPIRRVH
jgi:hypothetical protein